MIRSACLVLGLLVLACPACGDGGDASGAGTSGGGAGGAAPAELDILFEKAPTLQDPLQIFAMAPDGTGIRALTSSPSKDVTRGENGAPHWSPDGSRILFLSGRDAPMSFGPEQDLLFTMNPDGTDQRRLTSNDASKCSEHDGRFSHDGTRVVFSMSCTPDNTHDRLFVFTFATGETRPLLDPMQAETADQLEFPVFTFDDRRVVFVTVDDSATSKLDVVDVATGAVTRVKNFANQRSANGPLLASANSDRVFFLTGGDRAHPHAPIDFESIDVDGADEQVLFTVPLSPEGAVMRGYFSLTPDEHHLLFSQTYGEPTSEHIDLGISESNLDGSAARPITPPMGLVVGPVQR